MSVNVQNVSAAGTGFGIAFAVLPAAALATIACSKIILINVVVNVALAILTLGILQIEVYGIALIPIPIILWQISLACAVVGVCIAAIYLTAFLANKVYQRIACS